MGEESVSVLTGRDREAARQALEELARGERPELLVEAFGSPFWEIRSRAHELLADRRSKDLVPRLADALLSGDEDRCFWSVRTLSRYGGRAAPFLLQSLDRVPPTMRLYVLRALSACGIADLEGAVETLVRILDADDWVLREEAARLLETVQEKSLPAIRAVLKDGTKNQRFWAFKIMARVMGDAAVLPLTRILETAAEELQEDSRPYALAALKEIRSAAVIPPLLRLLADESWYMRAEAAELLTGLGDLAVRDLLEALRAEDDADVRFWIMKVLRRIMGEGAIDVLAEQLASPSKGARYSAVLTLAEIPSGRAAELLVGAFGDEAWVIRKAAAQALTEMGEVAVEPLLRNLVGEDEERNYWTLQTLGLLGSERAVSFVGRLLEHESRAIRLAAVDALGGVGGPAALRCLVEAFRNGMWTVRQRASEVVRRLGAPALVHLLAFVEDEHEDVAYWTRQTLHGFLLPGLESLLKEVRELPRRELPTVQEELGRMEPGALLRELARPEVRLADLLGAGWRNRPGPERTAGVLVAGPPVRDLFTIFDRHLGDPYDVPMDALLAEAQRSGASDLHLKVGCPPILRVNGELRRTKYAPLTAGHTIGLCGSILSALQKDELSQNLQLDMSYRASGGSRFRINLYMQTRGLEAACRYIDPRIPSFADLNLPERQMRRIASHQDGLVLVTGPTGCGKTTTLSAIVDYVNRTYARHVITIEDPIEYVHENVLSYISYREVGLDVRSFAMGLRGALREDPDVILIGELRDRETVTTALTLAGTGHLVLASFHTANASQTVEQLVDFFPAEQQDHVRRQLAFILKAVVSQRLFSRQDRPGRIPAYELLLSNTAVRNLIREGNTQQLFSVMQGASEAGMVTFDAVLQDLVDRRIVAFDEALPFVYDPTAFHQASPLRGGKGQKKGL